MAINTQEVQLAIDIGSTGVRIGEFEYPKEGMITLRAFHYEEFPELINEANRGDLIRDTLVKCLDKGIFTTRKASLCVSGQAAFMRFVTLPPVSEEESRIRQIVEYEAKQNVPFPMDEVVWDYQLISGAEEEVEVMFVVIKNDIIESIIRAVLNAGIKPTLVDFSPSALYNVARASGIGNNDCSMMLNIGGRCTTLLFLDGQRFFARTIPIGGSSITQQIAKEFDISTAEAETLKRRHGFVALGGAYEEPESEVAATISKIVRNVMTRLHGEVNRSISIYRTQQKGNKPTKLYLSGGSSTMAFTDHFFSEKLRMEVLHFQPFKNVAFPEGMEVKSLQQTAHIFPESVGVALRNLIDRECPVEIDLKPEFLKRQQSFTSRMPYILGSCVAWIIALFVFVVVLYKESSLFSMVAEKKQKRVQELQRITDKIKEFENKERGVQKKFDSLHDLIDQKRYTWSKFLNILQLCKPQDVWLLRIDKINAPRKSKNKKKGKKKKKNPFQKGKNKKKGKRKDQIKWFEITCQAITIPSNDPIRKIFTDEQVVLLQENERQLTEKKAKKPPEKKKGKKSTGEKASEDPWNSNTIKPDIILSEVFLRTLRSSGYFSENPEDTKIVATRFFERHPNMTSFTIQLGLIEPIMLKR